MSETADLILALKKALKQHQFKYVDVAAHLGLSEASIKRLFSQKTLTLSKLEAILSLMHMRMSDLVELLEEGKSYISELTSEQENSLIESPKLFLMFFLLLNAWPLEEITTHFDIDSFEAIRLLAKLDKLALIELLPLNRIKLLTAPNFAWRKNGPIQQLMDGQVLKEYFKDKFNHRDAKLVFLGGTLSDASIEKVKVWIDEMAVKIDALIREDRKLPLDKRNSVGAALAIRKWELGVFSKLRRK